MLPVVCLALFLERCLLQRCEVDVVSGMSCNGLRALSVAEV